jgi:hypothetical protein
MKNIISVIFIILFILIIIKYNSNNLNFLSNPVVAEDEEEMGYFTLEHLNNVPKNFKCDENEAACIFVYQHYNQECKDSIPLWKKFQDLNHERRIKGKKLKVYSIDSSKNPNLSLAGNVDGPRVSLVERYNVSEYDGRMNLKNLEKFLEKNL